MTQDENSRSERVSTGVRGLDEILKGGLLRGRLYLLQGEPGTGKTTLALQYLRECERRGEQGLYITLSETRSDLDSVAASHNWDISPLAICDLSASEDTLRADAQYTIFHPSDIELGETTQTVLAEVERVKPRHVVFDGLSEVRLLARDPLRYRRQMLALKQYFAEKGITVLVLDDRSTPLGDIQPESIVSGIINLEIHSPMYGGERRRVRVTKVRGSSFFGGYHDYNIVDGGTEVYPRLVAANHNVHVEPGGLPCGIEGLDRILDGGLEFGTTTVMIGPAGVGKSTVSMQYVVSALERGLPACVYTFDEVLHTLYGRARKLCPGFERHLDSQLLCVSQIDPAELSAGGFAHLVRTAVEENGAKVVVIDSLNGYMSSMPEERFLETHLHELFAYLNQRGVVTILVVAQHGAVGSAEASVDISYLADTVLMLRYFEANAEIRQAIGVFKKRTGRHERALRELTIGDNGIIVGEPLSQFRGIMTGIPQYGEETVGTGASSGANASGS
jgi:circadian clock protein KaiC